MENKNRKTILAIIALFVLIVLVIGVTYAAFSFSKVGNTANIIKTGTITMTYTEAENGITITNAMPMNESEGKILTAENQVFNFTVNINIVGNTSVAYEITAEKDISSTLANSDVRLYLQKCTDGTSYNDEVLAPTAYTPINAVDEYGAKNGEMILDTGSTNSAITYYYRLRMWVDSSYEISETAKSFKVKVNVYGKDSATTETPEETSNIVKAYTYDESSCITGEESSCVATTCYENEAAKSCPAGTIVKYKVNKNTTETFHVMYDVGKTMIMQSQKNIVNSVEWISASDYLAANTDSTTCSSDSCIDEGPLTILNAIEKATSNWTNVDDYYYDDATGYMPNATISSGCKAYNSCGDWPFVVIRTAKARILTVQEASVLGCTDQNKSCPIWMYNYLETSKSNGGTVNNTDAIGYWTLTADTSTTNYAWHINDTGSFNKANTSLNTYNGARAVVKISK